MWNIHSTTRLLKEMSTSAEPRELVRLFIEHIRRGIHVKRALVLNHAGLSSPHFRLVHSANHDRRSRDSVLARDEHRQGGLLAKILYRGKFQSIMKFKPDPSDPSFDLLRGSRSLMAFPLFGNGISIGMVVVLEATAHACKPADLCALATMSSLLSRAIETQKLADQLQATCRALDSELKAAADVQRWLLPPSIPTAINAGIAASYQAARYSGGDYYDVGKLPDGRLGVLIADVSGKGAAAAVLMAVLRTIVHDEVDRSKLKGPAALLDYVEGRLSSLGLPGRGAFVTAFSGAMDTTTGVFTYSSAGHNPPRLLRARKCTIESLNQASTVPLGLLDSSQRQPERTVVLQPGDLALFYTDGITEARSPGGEFFDVDRLDQTLLALPQPVTPSAAVEAVRGALGEFAAHGPLTDDQTLLAVGWQPCSENQQTKARSKCATRRRLAS